MGENADGIKRFALPVLFTNTVMVSDAEQPVAASVPVTVYIVLLSGEATGLEPVLLFKVAAGLQLYCVAPEAVNTALILAQSTSFDLAACTGGSGDTVTVVVRVSIKLQVFSFMITLYTVVLLVVVSGVALDALETAAAGLQVYWLPPLADN